MSLNRTQVYISPTRIKMFLECKFKFKHKYVLKTRPTNVIPPHVFGPGQTVHKLAQFYDASKFNQPESDKETEIRKYMRENRLEDLFYNSISEQYEVVIGYLKPFIEAKERGEIKLNKETKINTHWFGDYWFYGYADLRAQWPDKTIITDYKSSKSEGNHDIQMAIYAYSTAQSLKVPFEKIEINILYTKLNKKVVRVFKASEVKEILRNVACVLRDESKEEEYPKSPNQFCSNCEYYSLCKPEI